MSAPGTPSQHELQVPTAKQKVKVEVELVPADRMPDSLKANTNVTKVNVGGQEFYAVVGKTTTV